MNLALPDLCLLKTHIEEAPFTAGVAQGAWNLASDSELERWPYCRLWVESQPRFTESGRVGLRFTLDNYSASAPTAQPWDLKLDSALPPDKWPKGPGNVSNVFKPTGNPPGLYAPCDRAAMPGHDSWKHQFPQWWWTPDRTIVDYLTFIHRCLNPAGYVA